MSKFLGPIHYWLYGKTGHQETLTRCLAEAALKEGRLADLSSYVRDLPPLETVIDEGNTSIVAHSIAGKVVSDVFEIVPEEEYPFGYDDCYARAKSEQNSNARPAISDTFDSFDDYDTVYLGYPIWHSDLPMIMLTFIESKDWTGKKVMPFCTHGDSGLCGTDQHIKSLCKGADVKEGLAIKGSDAQAFGMDVDKAINTWLAKVRS